MLLFIGTFIYNEDLMQKSDDSSIYHGWRHEPKRAVRPKKAAGVAYRPA